MFKTVLKSTASVFILLGSFSLSTPSQAMREEDKQEEPLNNFFIFQENEEKVNNRPNPKTFKTPLKKLIILANEGDEKAQKKLTDLHCTKILPTEMYVSMKMEKWKNIYEKMEKDGKFLYLGFWTGVHSCFSDYFKTFFQTEDLETNPFRLLILGAMYSEGLLLEKPDSEKAIIFFQRALDKDKKNPLIYLQRGLCYSYHGQLENAKREYEEGKNLGNMECVYQLAISCDERTPPELVSRLYHEAATNGSILACSQLGVCYANGTGVPVNFMEAVRYMIKGHAKEQLEYISTYLPFVEVLPSQEPAISFEDVKIGDLCLYSQSQITCYSEESNFLDKNLFINPLHKACKKLVILEEKMRNCVNILKKYQRKESIGLFLTCFAPSEDFLNNLALQENPPFFAVHNFGTVNFLTAGEDMVPLANYLFSFLENSPFKKAKKIIRNLCGIEKKNLKKAMSQSILLRNKMTATESLIEQTKEEKEQNFLGETFKNLSLEFQILKKAMESTMLQIEFLKKEKNAITSIRDAFYLFFYTAENRNQAFLEEYDFLKPVINVENEDVGLDPNMLDPLPGMDLPIDVPGDMENDGANEEIN